MKVDLPGTCPHCGSDVMVTAYECPSCGTHTQGHFNPCPFCRLDAEDNRILFSFLVARGNLKEMEKDLELSYPTLRGRLEALLERLGVGSRPIPKSTVTPAMTAKLSELAPDSRVSQVLDDLKSGKLDVAEALEHIRVLRTNRGVLEKENSEVVNDGNSASQ